MSNQVSVESDVNFGIRMLIEHAKVAIINEDDEQFSIQTREMLRQAPHVSIDLRNQLWETIVDASFNLNAKGMTRMEIAKMFYNDSIKVCKKFLI